MSLHQMMSAGLAERLSSPDGQVKMADLSGKLIFDRLREEAFSSTILNMRPIGLDECQLSENSDTFVKMEFIEPQSRAMTMNFRGDSTAEIMRASRAFMSFYTIASQMWQKTEEEMQIYRSIPVSQILEQNTLKDMQELRDHGFLAHCEAAVQAMQKEANGGSTTTLNSTALQGGSPPVEFSVVKGESARNAVGTPNATALLIQRPDFVALKQKLSANRLEHAVVLISAPDLDGVDAWTLEDTGDRVQSDTYTTGFKGNMLLGLKVIKTVKTDMLRAGNVYLFTAPQFLGRFYLLNKTKFYVDKRFNRISWQAWETLGMMLLNVASVKKLELYSGDATSLDADSIRASVLPKAEGALGAKNNRVDEGVRYPQVYSVLPSPPSPGTMGVGNHAFRISGERWPCSSATSAPNAKPRPSAGLPAPAPSRCSSVVSGSCPTARGPWSPSSSSSTGQRCCFSRGWASSPSAPRTTSWWCAPRRGPSRILRLAPSQGQAGRSRRWRAAGSTPTRGSATRTLPTREGGRSGTQRRRRPRSSSPPLRRTPPSPSSRRRSGPRPSSQGSTS